MIIVLRPNVIYLNIRIALQSITLTHNMNYTVQYNITRHEHQIHELGFIKRCRMGIAG